MTGRNTQILVSKILLRNFLKIPLFQKILEFQDWKRGSQNPTKKENFKLEIKQTIENS